MNVGEGAYFNNKFDLMHSVVHELIYTLAFVWKPIKKR